jgi:hypothetical protein
MSTIGSGLPTLTQRCGSQEYHEKTLALTRSATTTTTAASSRRSLACVPFSVKDLWADVEGLPTTAGPVRPFAYTATHARPRSCRISSAAAPLPRSVWCQSASTCGTTAWTSSTCPSDPDSLVVVVDGAPPLTPSAHIKTFSPSSACLHRRAELQLRNHHLDVLVVPSTATPFHPHGRR